MAMLHIRVGPVMLAPQVTWYFAGTPDLRWPVDDSGPAVSLSVIIPIETDSHPTAHSARGTAHSAEGTCCPPSSLRGRAAAAAIPVHRSGVPSTVERTPLRCTGIAASLAALAPRNEHNAISTTPPDVASATRLPERRLQPPRLTRLARLHALATRRPRRPMPTSAALQPPAPVPSHHPSPSPSPASPFPPRSRRTPSAAPA